MTKSHTIQPQRIDIHRDFIASLTRQEIYSLTLISHIHNEISTLMRMLEHSFPKNEQTETERAGTFHMIQFFARLICGKIYEANEKLYQKHVQEFIKRWCIPYETPKSIATLSSEFKASFKQSKWLNRARNRHAMHYPKIEEWEKAIEFSGTHNFEVIVGSKRDELLFRTADISAFAAFSHEIDDTDILNGIEIMSQEIGPLALTLSRMTTQILGGFIQASKLSNPKRSFAKHKEAKKFKTIEANSLEIPYFFYHKN